MKTRSFWLAVVIGLQTCWIFGMAISKELALRRPTKVLLETAPVDPRDFLRGDYVILNYKISVAPPVEGLTPMVSQSLLNETVYVALEKRGRFHEAVSASLTPIEARPGVIVARGTLDRSRGSLRVQYGIEKYFVKEGTGNPRGVVTVECAVGKDGSLQIKNVFVDGTPYAEAMAKQ